MKAAGECARGEFVAQLMRQSAREIFQHALAESSVEQAFQRKVHYERGVLQVGEDLYDLTSFSRIFTVAIGKAAHPSLEALTKRLGAGVELQGIVSSPIAPRSQQFGFRYFQGGHPLPNSESLRAAEAVVRALESLRDEGTEHRSLVLFLLSGGGSAALEKPFCDELSFEDLIETHRVLVHSGAPIAEINALRKHLSAVKGGRLAEAAAGASQQLSILVSDVAPDALDSLASGPTMPDSSTAEDCYTIAEHRGLMPLLPAAVSELLRQRRLEETPKSDDPAFVRARWWPILSNETALKAAADRAARLGFAVEIDNRCDDWDYRKAGDYLLQRVRSLRERTAQKKSAPVCLLSGGELTVKVDAIPGRGGRNQHFALYCAQHIQNENICVLSAGTDGIDGNSPAAGAVADGTTLNRAGERALSAEGALAAFGSYSFFNALGDTIVTGETGTNVRDVRLLLAW
jgi:glycerate 2-kinase